MTPLLSALTVPHNGKVPVSAGRYSRCLVPANGRGHLHASDVSLLQPTPWACRR